jgi:cytidylate kinase
VTEAPSTPRTVAIDGPAGSGKSTVARLMAERLGAARLDTGAMYRAVAWRALDRQLDLDDEDAVADLARGMALEVADRVLVDGTDVTEAIRTPEVDVAVSRVAAHPAVRRELVARQQRWAADHATVVVEGRDIGTVVLPDADLKLYLTASVAERARRRSAQRGRGAEDLATVAAQLERRDRLDSERAASPLPSADQVASDALVLDTTDRPPTAVVEQALAWWASHHPGHDTGRPADQPAERLVDDQVDQPTERLVDGQAVQPAQRLVDGQVDPEGPGVSVSAHRHQPTGRTAVSRPATSGTSIGADPAVHHDGQLGVSDRTYRLLRGIAHGINRVCWRVEVVGADQVPASGPVVLAPVHRSFVDFFVVSEVTRRKIFYMAKEELWRSPRLGALVASLGAFPVDRAGTDRAALHAAQAVLERGDVLILFPEGTRRRGPVVEELHEGATFLAARTGATVVPIGIGGSDRVMPLGSRVPRPVKVRLVVGRPLPAPERSGSGRVSRSQVRAMTDALRLELQRVYDEACGRATADGQAEPAG